MQSDGSCVVVLINGNKYRAAGSSVHKVSVGKKKKETSNFICLLANIPTIITIYRHLSRSTLRATTKLAAATVLATAISRAALF